MHGHWGTKHNCNVVPTKGLSYYSLFQPTAWYNAENMMEMSGSTIVTWHDRTPQPTPGLSDLTVSLGAPQYIANGINNCPSVHFTGGDSMEFDAPGATIDQTLGEIWMVFQPTASVNANVLNYGEEGNSSARVSLTTVIDGPIGQVEGDTFTNVSTIANSSGYVNKRFCLRFKIEMGQTDGLKLYLGENLYDEATPVGDYINNPENKFIVADAGVFEGYVAEIILYNKVLTTRQALCIKNYLCKRYNINSATGWSAA